MGRIIGQCHTAWLAELQRWRTGADPLDALLSFQTGVVTAAAVIRRRWQVHAGTGTIGQSWGALCGAASE